MNIGAHQKEQLEVNITPLIDVVFLLLIFFMVSTTFERESEIEIMLPEATASAKTIDEFVLQITIDEEGSVVLSDRQNHRLSIFTKEGKLIKRWGKYGEGKYIPGGQLSEPHGVATDSKGNIFVCDRYNFRIQRFNKSGEVDILWNAAGPEDDSKQFVLGIVVNNDDAVYVTDHYHHCVQKYKP